jgi:hypothetical protein
VKPLRRARVIIRSVRDYDAERIRTVVREGLNELGIEPRGRTLVKPNLVVAGDMFRHAHTRPEFGEGVLLALQDCDRAHPELGNTKNPYLDPREILRFNVAYLGWRAKRAANWADGIPYLGRKEVARGGAAPTLERPNEAD